MHTYTHIHIHTHTHIHACRHTYTHQHHLNTDLSSVWNQVTVPISWANALSFALSLLAEFLLLTAFFPDVFATVLAGNDLRLLILGQCTNLVPWLPLYALDFFPCVCVPSLPQDRESLEYNVTLYFVEMLHKSTKMKCSKLQTMLNYQNLPKYTTGDG